MLQAIGPENEAARNRSGPDVAAGRSEGLPAVFRTAAMQSATKERSLRPCRRSEPLTVLSHPLE